MKKKRRTVLRSCMSLALAGSLAVSSLGVSAAAESQEANSGIQVGAAVRDITPTLENGMLPIDGVGKTTLVGVLDPIHVRVIAIRDDEDTFLMVATETGKGPYGPQYAESLAEHTGIPVESIFELSTHAHAVPEIKEEIDLDFEEDDPEVTNMQRWGKLVMDQMLDAADEALENMEPATVEIGYSESYINVNRNRYYTAEDGSSYRSQGYNPTGVSDKTVTALQFNNMEEEPIAFVVNYPVHGTVMYANQCIDGGTGVSSDIPGYVSNCLESTYEDSVAIWCSGAAGDQNPIIANEYFTPSIETGEKETTYMEGGNTDILDFLGKILYADVLTALDNAQDVTGDIDISSAYGGTEIPATEEHDADTFGLQLQVLRIGDIAFVGCAGELFNSIGLYMQENSILEDTIIVNHVWTHEEQSLSYLADDDGRINGGQGCNAPYEPGYINDALTDLMNELLESTQQN